MSKTPSIGEMRKVVKFEQANKTSDGTGGQTEGYNEWLTCRGYLEKNSSSRPFETGFDDIVNDYDLYVPFRSAIESNLTRDTKVIYEARKFGVVNWELIGEQRSMYKIHLKESV